MALYGSARDVSLFRNLNRELMWDIISQQCVVYQLKTAETRVNIYGESSGAKFYNAPVIFNVLIERGDISQKYDDFGVSYDKPTTFRFLRDDLIDANVVMAVGDIVMWHEAYWELNNVSDNQLVVGKDPDYPYKENPLNSDLENFGSNLSVICTAHYVPADRVGITKERV